MHHAKITIVTQKMSHLTMHSPFDETKFQASG
jgi:hypothetical protein